MLGAAGVADVRPVFGPCKELCEARGGDGEATSVGTVADDPRGDPSAGRGLVLVVEDEPAIADVIRRYLVADGFGVHTEYDGLAALAAVATLRPAAVLLDVGLPGLDGIEVCRRMRETGDWTPVLFVTARDDEVDRVLGLEIGADDYLTKPFLPRELVARVRAVLRRADGRPGPGLLSSGALRLDPARRAVTVGGEPVELTTTEFNLLEALLQVPGHVLSRSALLARAWGQADYAGSRTVDVHVAQLRAKLGVACPIETVRGIGYRVRT
jgi:DNA-binding response OmpR family regulator